MSALKGRGVSLVASILLLAAVLIVRRSEGLKGWAFLANQTDCKLSCQNGGVCAFNTETPDEHKCICFIGMFYGEQCEFPVPDDVENEMANEDEERIEVEESVSESEPGLENLDSAHSKPTLTLEEGGESDGVGGSLGVEEPDLGGGAARLNEESREELSYESELLLNGNVRKSTVSPADNYGSKNAEEVELLKNTDADEYSNNVVAPNAGEYSHIDVTVAPTVAEPQLGYNEYHNNLAAPFEPTTPLYGNNDAEVEQHQIEPTVEATAASTDAYADTSTGAGGSFLSADDGEAHIFHGNPNLKQYESARTTHRIEPDRARYTSVGSEVALDSSPTQSTPSASSTTRRRGGAGARRKSRPRPTTTQRPAYGGGGGSEEGDADDSYDDGWMMSAKRRSAPSAASHLWRRGAALTAATNLGALLLTIYGHFARHI